MQHNNFSLLYEASVTTNISESNEQGNILVIEGVEYVFYKKTSDYLNQTTTYFLYFNDMISQHNFMNNVLKTQNYSFNLKGYTPYVNRLDDLEGLVNE